MKVLVHALDSTEGRAAFERGVEEALLRDAGLAIATYVRIDAEGSSPERTSGGASKRLDELAAQAKERGVADVTSKVLPGIQGAAHELLDLADSLPAQLLIVGVRRRTRVGKLVLGSVSQDLILGANCPVMAVKSADDH